MIECRRSDEVDTEPMRKDGATLVRSGWSGSDREAAEKYGVYLLDRSRWRIKDLSTAVLASFEQWREPLNPAAEQYEQTPAQRPRRSQERGGTSRPRDSGAAALISSPGSTADGSAALMRSSPALEKRFSIQKGFLARARTCAEPVNPAVRFDRVSEGTSRCARTLCRSTGARIDSPNPARATSDRSC